MIGTVAVQSLKSICGGKNKAKECWLFLFAVDFFVSVFGP